jgi:hypothetical protein
MDNITNYIIGGGIALIALLLLSRLAKKKAKKKNAQPED